MTKKTRLIRLIVNSVLVVGIVALAVTVYQAGTQRNSDEPISPQIAAGEDDKALDSTSAPLVDAGTSDVEAQVETQADTDTEDDEEPAEEEAAQAETPKEDAESADAAAQAEAVAPVIDVDFTEESLMDWPLEGQVLLDYSMDHTIYHPTLDLYKYSKGIAIQSSVGSPVLAASNGTVASIEEMSETGTTVVLDLGNGYQNTYGQLKDLNVVVGQTIPQGTIIGYVNEPTKYYTEEGCNLYFSMSKDGTPVDPIQYLP